MLFFQTSIIRNSENRDSYTGISAADKSVDCTCQSACRRIRRFCHRRNGYRDKNHIDGKPYGIWIHERLPANRRIQLWSKEFLNACTSCQNLHHLVNGILRRLRNHHGDMFRHSHIMVYQSRCRNDQYRSKSTESKRCILPVFGFYTVYSSLFLALGKAKDGFILGACRQGICFVPIILILPYDLGNQRCSLRTADC